MARLLKYEGVGTSLVKNKPFQLVEVTLTDEAGNKYKWFPKWKDMYWIYQVACLVEILNRGPSSPDLLEFALTGLIINDVVMDTAKGGIIAKGLAEEIGLN